MEDEVKTPEQMAEKEVNKKLGSSIADRQLKIKKLQSQIKKLEKEIEKIKSGELVPDVEDNSSSSSVMFILDESGSMNLSFKETISGFNEYVDTLKKENKNIKFSLTKFNSVHVKIQYENKKIVEVPRLNGDCYEPDGMTPLYDAIGKTVCTLGKGVKETSGKTLLVIMTDGYENCSVEYTKEAINELIKTKENEGWAFVYLGADHDAWSQAGSLGLSRGNIMSFKRSNMRGTMASLGSASVNYMSSQSSRTTDFFKEAKTRSSK